MKRLILIPVLLLCQGLVYAQLTPPTFAPTITHPAYTEEVTVMTAGIKTMGDVYYLTGSQKINKRTYVDGLGRVLQEIRPDMGTSGLPDLVSFSEYDAKGRQRKQYLPYAANTSRLYQSNAVTAQAAFYATSNTSGKYAKDNDPYAESVFDNSPLNEVLQQGSAGSAWQLSTGKVKAGLQRTNTVADYVRQFNTDGSSSGFYAAGVLNVSQGTDEEGHKILVFADKAGNTLLKREWVDETIQGSYKDYKNTYYLYHQSGLLMMMLPPKVVDRMMNNGWTLSTDDLNNNIYRYEYDAEGRLIGKKGPSSGWIYTIYDQLDRVCLVQSAVQRTGNKWFFVKYDKLGRTVMQGVLQDDTHTTRASMQSYCDTYDYLNPAVACYETRGSTVQNYTDVSFPQSTAFTSFSPLTVNYYDSYDIDNNGSANYTYTTQSLGAEEPVAGASQGQLTVVMSRKLGTNDWISKVYFYDAEGRVVQEQSNNTTNSAVADVYTNVLSFGGLIKRSLNKKTINGTAHTVDENMTYDNASRISSVSHKYNSNAAVTLADYVYNELGRLVDKNLGKLGPGSYLQSVDLRYNIRGWLTGINNADLTNDGYNEESNDVFGMDILYNASGGIGNTAMYNGQISGVKWRAKMGSHPFDNVGRAYTYSYDKLGQVRNALFYGNNGSGWSYRNGAFDEKNIGYDLNGNLLNLERNMWNGSSVVSMDILSYSYKSTGGNDRLMQVIDANGTGGSYGFKNQSNDSEHYLYDEDGNLIQDKNKNLTYTYNDLGKVNRVTLLSYTNRYIQYHYDGAGVCLSKQVVDNGSTIKTTAYADDFVAVDHVLSYINTAEGRVRTASGVGTYEYYIKDHLGNVRVSFEDVSGAASVRQENSFYAFGLVHNATIVPSGANKNITADAEWENDFGNDPDLYTMPFRQYDPVLGRFNAVDPVAEQYQDLTVYNFCFNNPVSFSDPSGADPFGSWDNIWDMLNYYWNISGPFGGSFGTSGSKIFTSHLDAFAHFDQNYNEMWARTTAGSFQTAYDNFINKKAAQEKEDRLYDRVAALRVVNIEETYKNSNWLVDRQKEAFGISTVKEDESVGQPGFGESLIPIWGSGRAAVDDFQNGRYGWAAFNTAMAVSDVFLVKSIVTGIAKGGAKMLTKSYAYWSSARRFYGKEKFAEAGQHLHHWALARNGAKKGEGFTWWAKNQMWNLMPMESISLHQSVHGVGATPFGPLRQFYYGTPIWFKSSVIGTGGDITNQFK